MPGHSRSEINQQLWAQSGFNPERFRVLAKDQLPPPGATISTLHNNSKPAGKLPRRGSARRVLAYIRKGETPEGRHEIIFDLHSDGFSDLAISQITGMAKVTIAAVIKKRRLDQLRLPEGTDPWWYRIKPESSSTPRRTVTSKANLKRRDEDVELLGARPYGVVTGRLTNAAWKAYAKELYKSDTATPTEEEFRAMAAALECVIRELENELE